MKPERRYAARIIEVDLPIREISAQARREKSIRHGHISTLHIWWARRPLAACRAVILAALWPDPADPLCPERFRAQAANAMKDFRDQRGGTRRDWNDPVQVRAALLDFIAEFANWDNSTNAAYLEVARRLVQVAHESLGGSAGTRPLVVDPFAGGGAIPLEALRVGADVFASDLNPVAVLLNKVVLEYIPKHGKALADEVRKWGRWVKQEAAEELARFYPRETDGSTPIAYLWARTIKCEGPGCGVEVPLLRSLWLAKKGKRSVALKVVPDAEQNRLGFQIVENAKASLVGEGTVRRGSASCPNCGYTTPVASVRAQLRSRCGGAHDARLLAVVRTHPSEQGRFYRLPNDIDLAAARAAGNRLEELKALCAAELSLVPDEPVNEYHHDVNRLPMYGMRTWGDAFSSRALLALTSLGRLVRECPIDGERDLAIATRVCLALAVDRQADYSSTLCSWAGDFIRSSFGRQALAIVWDFAEVFPFSGQTGDFGGAIDWIARVIEQESRASMHAGSATQVDATRHSLPDDSAMVLFTDPPYYDAIDYAVIADFYYVWLRRTLAKISVVDLLPTETPKEREIVVDATTTLGHGVRDAEFFERMMTEACAEGRRYVIPNGVGIVVFAHKSTAGWEAQLGALINAGWIITASWPVDTERPGRMRAINSAALASSVHLVCRPRENADGSLLTEMVGDWRAVLRELPLRIHQWMPRLSQEGVVGADAIFACLGPALEIFSRYSRVEKASGERVDLREYLEQVWAAVAREALSMIFEDADATGLEEDARLTAMWLWTLSTSGNGGGNGGPSTAADDEEDAEGADDEEEGTGKAKPGAGFFLEFDAARKIAQGLGAHLEDLVRVVEIKGDQARLLSVAERTRHLFGKDQAQRAPARRTKKVNQRPLFEELEAAEKDAGWGDVGLPPLGESTLDRVHQAMALFGAGRGEALKRFLVEEGVGRAATFWKLAQSLSALYPSGTDEKRWVDGVLARKKGLGFG